MEHPYFQRLRKIKQLGLTHLVYPGALHTRFSHALGAVHLMQNALRVLQEKGVEISSEECEAVIAAIFLHDIGHGPFSHALENLLIEGMSHEEISILLMQQLNVEMNGRLSLCIDIFTNKYEKQFLHQLVSSQLDMDRLDYLNRDSFFTGVSEGVISWDRIIQMLTVYQDQLMVEAKGIHSIEKFIIARSLMYWQVYLHKTVLAAEFLLIDILKRAKFVALEGKNIYLSKALKPFLGQRLMAEDFRSNQYHIATFTALDDDDIMAAIKEWQHADDAILADMCRNLLNRNLNRVWLRNKPFEPELIEKLNNFISADKRITKEEVSWYLKTGEVSNQAFGSLNDRIRIKSRTGEVQDVAEISDQLNLNLMQNKITKYYLYYPKDAEHLIREH